METQKSSRLDERHAKIEARRHRSETSLAHSTYLPDERHSIMQKLLARDWDIRDVEDLRNAINSDEYHAMLHQPTLLTDLSQCFDFL